jgi:hypothetical protein
MILNKKVTLWDACGHYSFLMACHTNGNKNISNNGFPFLLLMGEQFKK